MTKKNSETGINNWASRAKASLILRYLIVGVFNTGVGYLLYAFFLYVGLDYKLANFLALVIGIVISFKTQGTFVFNNTKNRLFGRFVVGWVLVYLFTIALIGQIIELGFNAYWAGAMALPFSVTTSFLIQKYYVFRAQVR